MADPHSGSPDASAAEEPIVVGLLADPGLTHDLAEELEPELTALLRKRFPEVEWKVVVEVEPLAGAVVGSGVDVVQVARRRMLTEHWKLVICLTDLPLHLGRRPVTAYASATLGVGVVSVPALGVVAVETRARRAVLRLVEGLLGESVTRRERTAGDRERRARIGRRLRELAFPVGRAYVQDDRTVRFVTATGRGNLRLLAGMVRERVVLFNLATALTVAVGVLTLFLALLAINLVSGTALIAPGVLEGQLQHEVGAGDYLRLAWLVSALATVGGALGAVMENDVVFARRPTATARTSVPRATTTAGDPRCGAAAAGQPPWPSGSSSRRRSAREVMPSLV
jgi:hypothetical protein